MRLATWNINGINARMAYLESWIEERNPDVVGLQELKIVDEAFPSTRFQELGYYSVSHGQKAWNGVAILSRLAMKATQIGLPGQEENGSRLIAAQIGNVHFTTVYCPNGKTLEHEDFQMKLRWLDSLADYCENIKNRGTVVVCGDFNAVPAAIDSHMGKEGEGLIFHTDQERARLRRLSDLGLKDLYREKNPDQQAFSWWDYRGGAFRFGRGLRIDLMLGSESFLQQVIGITIDRDFRKKKEGMTASDHAPVYVDLD